MLAAGLDVQHEFSGRDGDWRFGLAVEKEDGDRLGFFVPDDFGVVLVVPKFNQRATVRSLVLFAMVMVMSVVSIGIGGLDVTGFEFLVVTTTPATAHLSGHQTGDRDNSHSALPPVPGFVDRHRVPRASRVGHVFPAN